MAYDYRGAVHLHSTYSDGTGTVDEIMQAANEAGLDYVLLTDHDHLKAAADGHEKWHGSTLLIVGAEITPEYNHYLAYGLPADAPIGQLHEKPAQEVIDAVARLGGFGSIAHPDHTGTARFDIRSYAWKDWSVKGFTGMGIWDLMTDWQEVVEEWKGGPEIVEQFAKHLRGPKEATLKRWDELNQKGFVFGVGEIDNHAKRRTHEGQEFVIFPYAEAFKTIANHVVFEEPLPKDPGKAKAAVLAALRAGRFYIGFNYFYDAAGFTFEASDGDTTVGMGGTLTPTEDCELFFELPEEAYAKVICDGQVTWEGEAADRLVEVEQPGVYRVEAYRDGLMWIVSNPIVIKGE
jgi:hypothetical protein